MLNVLRGAYVVALSFGIALFGVLITQFVQRVLYWLDDTRSNSTHQYPDTHSLANAGEYIEINGAGGGEIPFHGETL